MCPDGCGTAALFEEFRLRGLATTAAFQPPNQAFVRFARGNGWKAPGSGDHEVRAGDDEAATLSDLHDGARPSVEVILRRLTGLFVGEGDLGMAFRLNHGSLRLNLMSGVKMTPVPLVQIQTTRRPTHSK
jgi:hypothetical protein